MSQSPSSDNLLGFLAIRDLSAVGLVGGLLLVNTMGRPVEFHCTAPVIASKTQQVLYGSTLNEFLQVEVIGRALLQQSKRAPVAVLVDEWQLMALSDWAPQPVVFAQSGFQSTNSDSSTVATDRAAPISVGVFPKSWDERSGTPFAVGPVVLRRVFPFANWQTDRPGQPADQVLPAEARKTLELLGSQLPLLEPFERIRQAIEEAHGGANAVAA